MCEHVRGFGSFLPGHATGEIQNTYTLHIVYICM